MIVTTETPEDREILRETIRRINGLFVGALNPFELACFREGCRIGIARNGCNEMTFFTGLTKVELLP